MMISSLEVWKHFKPFSDQLYSIKLWWQNYGGYGGSLNSLEVWNLSVIYHIAQSFGSKNLAGMVIHDQSVQVFIHQQLWFVVQSSHSANVFTTEVLCYTMIANPIPTLQCFDRLENHFQYQYHFATFIGMQCMSYFSNITCGIYHSRLLPIIGEQYYRILRSVQIKFILVSTSYRNP